MRTIILLAGLLLATITGAQTLPDPSTESELAIKVQLPNYAPWGADQSEVHEAVTAAGYRWKDVDNTGIMKHVTYGTDSLSLMFTFIDGQYASFAHLQVLPTMLDATAARAGHKIHYLAYAPDVQSPNQYSITYKGEELKLAFIVENTSAIRFSIMNMTLLRKIATNLKKKGP